MSATTPPISAQAKIVVVSSAIKRDNPELAAARARHLPVVRRAEMLAELMRFKQAVAIAGTHGKTTTTSMVAALLDAGGLDPTVINGGIINAYGTNARMGASDWMVVEADESDGTFVKLPADVALVTNIDPEHLDHYGSFERVREAFLQFVENVPFYGFAVMCIDHPEVQALVGRIEDRRIITYGASPQADVRYTDLRVEDRQVGVHRRLPRPQRRHGAGASKILSISMPGAHNVQNATGAIAVARGLGVADAAIVKGLAGFGGVKRRFTHTGTWNGVEYLRRLRPSPGGDRRRAEGRALDLAAVTSSPSCSRIATRGFAICSISSAPASTMPTSSSSRRSIRPARRRSRASTAMRWSRGCACAGIATPARSRGRRISRR